MDIRIEIVFDEDEKMHVYAYDEYGNKVGFIDAIISNGSLEITCIYVVEACRRMSIADMMLDELGDLLVMNGVLADMHMTYRMSDSLESLDKFIKSRYDFQVVEDSFEYLVKVDEWSNCKTASDLQKLKDKEFKKIHKLDELNHTQLQKLIECFKNHQIDITNDDVLITEYYNSELSYVAEKENDIVASILAREDEDLEYGKVIEISALICEPGNELHLMGGLSRFLSVMIERYADYSIRFVTINERSLKLVEKIFGEASIKNSINTAVWLGI